MLHSPSNDADQRQITPKGRKVMGCFGVVFGSLFLAIGLWVVAQAWLRGREQASTAGWPATEGQILSFNTVKDKERLAHSPLLYEFTVSGAVYRSTQVAMVDAINLDYQEWIALANRLPVEGKVKVYYDPSDPSRSVLKPGPLDVSYNGMKFGLGFAGFAAIWMTLWWVMGVWLPDRLSKETYVGSRAPAP